MGYFFHSGLNGRRSVLLLLFLFSALICQADQPPCWCEFFKESANKQFVAHVKKVNQGPLKPGQQEEWELLVFRRNNTRDSTLLWKSHYRYDGYPDGILSDNGKTFAYVNYWYPYKASAVELYRSGKHTGSIPGTAFNIPASKLSKTVSHQLWLATEGQPYEFVMNADRKDYFLKIRTIDGRTHLIDGATGQFKKS